jgi:hypothetical protein
MKPGDQGVPKIDTLISVQGTYPIRITDAGVLTCDDVIKVPLGYVAKRQTVIDKRSYSVIPVVERGVPIDKRSYNVIPVVEMVVPIEHLVFEIITNEGATVEPFSTLELPDAANPYKGVRFYFVLPPGTTGIKDVIFKPKYPSMRVALQFEVLPPPYNYDNALFGVITSAVSALDGRVDALESKTVNLKLVTKTPTFVHVELPKGAGKQTINIEDGVLFYDTSFSYPLSTEPTIHKPKITLHGAGRDQVYTLSLNKTTNTISIDLLTGMLTAYAGVTGEILQQFKLALPYHGFETLSFENFDDINDNVLRVTLKGARVV